MSEPTDPHHVAASQIEVTREPRIHYCDVPGCKAVGSPGVLIRMVGDQGRVFTRWELCLDCAAWLLFKLRQLELPLKICP